MYFLVLSQVILKDIEVCGCEGTKYEKFSRDEYKTLYNLCQIQVASTWQKAIYFSDNLFALKLYFILTDSDFSTNLIYNKVQLSLLSSLA